jgi:hypothetical protein
MAARSTECMGYFSGGLNRDLDILESAKVFTNSDNRMAET